MTPDSQLERKLAAILFADVVGYSKLTGEDEDGTYLKLRECIDLLASEVSTRHGKIVNIAGDAVLAEFPTVSEALKCAMSFQKALGQTDSTVPAQNVVQFRIGIHLGEVIADQGDIFGDGVNIAARLEGLADPGGVCISQSAYQAVGSKLPYRYDDIGAQKVKNIDKPINAYKVIVDTSRKTKPRKASWRTKISLAAGVAASCLLFVAFWVYPWEDTQSERASGEGINAQAIAVLPFHDLGADKNEAYFSDGITNDIITDLSRFSNLLVIASNSVFAYKGISVDIKKLGQELKVGYVLEGSIQRDGRKVRINVQLIDARTNHHIWANRYGFEISNLFEIQDEITHSVVSELQVQLTKDEQEREASRFTTNLEAYDNFLRGRTYLRGNRRAHEKARQLFDKAIELDPEFAAAYAEKSMTFFPGFIMPMTGDEKVVKEALWNAERAVALDPKLPLANARLSWALFANHRHKHAIVVARQAIRLGPSNAEARVQFGNLLNWSGRPEEGLKEIKLAMRLNPRYPFYYLFYLGHSYYLLERHDEAIKLMKRVVTRAPNFLPVKRHLAVLYEETGQHKLAKEQVRQTLRIFPGASIEDERARCYYMWTPALQNRFFSGLRKAGMPEGVPGKKPIDM